eukprot:6858041-Prymnesium_polylepis.1
MCASGTDESSFSRDMLPAAQRSLGPRWLPTSQDGMMLFHPTSKNEEHLECGMQPHVSLT